MDFITIYNFPPLISSILFLILGFLVFIKNKKSKINKKFLIICFVTFWWQFSWFILFSLKDEVLAGYLVKIGYVGIIFIPITFFHYFVSFLESVKKIDKYILRFSYILGGVFTIILFSSDFFISGFYQYFWGFYPKAGIIHPIYLLFLSILATRIFYISLVDLKLRRITLSYKYYQTKFVLWALGFYVLSAVDFVVNYGYEIYPFGFLFIIIFLGIIAYTIVTHRLMDIKIVLRKSSVYLISLSTVLILVVAVKYIFIKFFPDFAIWLDIIILILALSVFPPIKKHYYRLANKYFFTSLYDGRTVIADLSDKLRSTLKAENIYKYLSETFINSFHTKAVGILTYDEKTKNYLVEYNKGFNFGKQKKIHLFSNFRNAFIKQNQPVVVEEIKHVAYKKHKKTIDLLTKFGVEIVTPLNVKNETIGLIVLGQKESGDMYNNEDLSVLEIIGAQAAIAIENALLYEETKNFAAKLKKEVKKATADVKDANKQLRKLDAAKSNFISIASHQLRTPLTVIKGYISMMIEGSFGKVTKEELESLKKVYESNERLIQLVEDLLNISRIESGKLQFDFHETRLEEVVESVAEELSESAKQKGLALTYKKPNKPLPMVKIDGEKIRYVVLNLIDNSIKYTKQGSVTISLRLGVKHIHFCVVDTGIGIGKEDLSNLFKKFSRGKDISTVNPEGTGMGLYVGRMMIKAHQGTIWAESEGEGKGSKFCFSIPI